MTVNDGELEYLIHRRFDAVVAGTDSKPKRSGDTSNKIGLHARGDDDGVVADRT